MLFFHFDRKKSQVSSIQKRNIEAIKHNAGTDLSCFSGAVVQKALRTAHCLSLDAHEA